MKQLIFGVKTVCFNHFFDHGLRGIIAVSSFKDFAVFAQINAVLEHFFLKFSKFCGFNSDEIPSSLCASYGRNYQTYCVGACFDDALNKGHTILALGRIEEAISS